MISLRKQAGLSPENGVIQERSDAVTRYAPRYAPHLGPSGPSNCTALKKSW
ncbi:hypothetical protein [Streptomyces phaeochromogenes]|uniref:hypothetical protein n=1 Tax=Streptomyces phaeochromogenes TaxID=1923 RepID=UPI00372232A0